MDNEKVNEALRECNKAIGWGVTADRWQGREVPRHEDKLHHVRWMIVEALSWRTERLEKKMRWLGFIQGVLWAEGIQSIEEAKRQNMPSHEEFDDTHLSPDGK